MDSGREKKGHGTEVCKENIVIVLGKGETAEMTEVYLKLIHCRK